MMRPLPLLCLLAPLAACEADWQLEDRDGDGYTLAEGDCDDNDPVVNPGAEELCDGRDTNCDGQIDNGASDGQSYFEDRDDDGFGDPDRPVTGCTQPEGSVTEELATDCNDDDPDAFPGSYATEIPGDGLDQNCDGLDVCVDLTCDTLPDLLVAGYERGGGFATDVRIYASSPDFTFPTTAAYTIPAHSVADIQTGDLNDSGYIDLVWISGERDGATALTVLYGSSDYSVSPVTSLPASHPSAVQLADVNDDGLLDIVVANYRTDASYEIDSYVYLGHADGFSTTRRVALPTRGATALAVRDLNGDGAPEIVFCNEQSDHPGQPYRTDSTVYWGQGSGTPFVATDHTDLATTGCSDVEVGNLNTDALPDIVFAQRRDALGGQTTSRLYLNDGDRFDRTPVDLVSDRATSVDLGDVNGDGLTDLVFGFDYTLGSANGTLSVHLNEGNFGAFSGVPATGSPITSATAYPILAGVSADRDQIIGPSIAASGELRSAAWVYDGGAFQRRVLPANQADRVAALDLDGDGELDLAFTIVDGASSRIALLFNNGGFFSADRRIDLDADASYTPPQLVGTWPEPQD